MAKAKKTKKTKKSAKKETRFDRCKKSVLEKGNLKRRPGSKYKTKEEIAAAICAKRGWSKLGKTEMNRRIAAGRKAASKSRGRSRESSEGISRRIARGEAIHITDDLLHVDLTTRRRVIAELLMDAAVHGGFVPPPEDFLTLVVLVLDPLSTAEDLSGAFHKLKHTGVFERSACAKLMKKVCSSGWKAAAAPQDAEDLGATMHDFVTAAFEVGQFCVPC